uniref:Uncharacterized protein n=1 Tax=Labrus bergylta TaxID=56723 RepID=A0A3Q3GED0_9LABR
MFKGEEGKIPSQQSGVLSVFGLLLLALLRCSLERYRAAGPAFGKHSCLPFKNAPSYHHDSEGLTP